LGDHRRVAGFVLGIVFALVVSAPAFAVQVDQLPSTTTKLRIPAAVQRACAARELLGARGAKITQWTSTDDGSVAATLAGTGDWDLALFDARTARRLDASLGARTNEVAQAFVHKNQTILIQACRISGKSSSARLTISPVALPAKANAALRKAGVSLTSNLATAARSYASGARAAAASPLPSGRTTYRHYPDVQADLKQIVASHPAIARPIVLPKKSFQGRDIEGIEVSDRVSASDDGKPTFFLMGEHHAREWPSAEIPVEFGIYLTNQFGKDARVTALLKKVRVVIVPVINPDGYIASREATDPADSTGDPAMAPSLAESVAPPGGSLAYRRKNCDGESPSPATPCALQYGVDPNRNYGMNWGGPGAGTNPGDQDYRGSDMWSEPETQAVHEFSQTHDVTTLITMHNFASLVLRPPGVHNAGLAPDEDALKVLGDKMAAATGYTSEYGFQLYDTSGTTEDWNYGAAGTFGYTIEMGPSSDLGGNFHISYDRAVVNQWTGAESGTGVGKGLREALLLSGEAAANKSQFSTLAGTAKPGKVLRVRKDFTTWSSDICTVETTGVDCAAQGAVLPKRSRADFLDYSTVVPKTGKFSWLVTPSTRPFELKAGKTEHWTLTCEDPGTHKVLESRTITVDRGQTLQLAMNCGGR
jgi:hypothetical protein